MTELEPEKQLALFIFNVLLSVTIALVFICKFFLKKIKFIEKYKRIGKHKEKQKKSNRSCRGLYRSCPYPGLRE